VIEEMPICAPERISLIGRLLHGRKRRRRCALPAHSMTLLVKAVVF
jgi:hypothetical protein